MLGSRRVAGTDHVGLAEGTAPRHGGWDGRPGHHDSHTSRPNAVTNSTNTALHNTGAHRVCLLCLPYTTPQHNAQQLNTADTDIHTYMTHLDVLCTLVHGLAVHTLYVVALNFVGNYLNDSTPKLFCVDQHEAAGR